jgi:hypothetical protein
LTALLFAADQYLPASVDHAQSADLDKTIIRIRSAQHLPEKIVLDTRSPAIVAPMAPAAEVADSSSREVFAAMTEATAPKAEEQKPLLQKRAHERPWAKRSVRRVVLDSARPVWTLLAISQLVSAAIVLVFRPMLPV